MSYISAFRLPEFIVMSADTQESYNDEICYEEKIEIESTATFDLAVGGAGRSELIEGFIRSIIDEINRQRPDDSSSLYQLLTSTIQNFYANDVRNFPGKSKGVKFLIASRNIASKEVNLWKSAGTRIKEVKKYGCIGYGGPLATNLARRLYRPDLSASQTVLLSVYIAAIAKSSSKLVGGDTQVVFIRDNGIWPEPGDDVQFIESRFREITPLTDRLSLAAPDLGLTENTFGQLLDEYRDKVLQLRTEYKAKLAEQMLTGKVNWPYEKLPVGSTVFQSLKNGKPTVTIYSDPQAPQKSETVFFKEKQMKPRVFNSGEPRKPIRVLLEKDGKPYGSVTTYPEGWTPPDAGEAWDEKHTVVSGRLGIGDATWDEVVLTVKENS